MKVTHFLKVPEVLKRTEGWEHPTKGCRSQPERALNDQIWNNLNNTINDIVRL